MADVKTDWAEVLGGFTQNLEAIAWALQHLPADRAPTALQFRELCLQAPRPALKALPEPKADPAVVDRVMREMSSLRDKWQEQHQAGEDGVPVRKDRLAWARTILERQSRGDHTVSHAAVTMARNALGVTKEARA